VRLASGPTRLGQVSRKRHRSEKRKKHDHFREFVRSEVAPDFREMLCRLRPELANESESVRAAFAYIVWYARIKGRRHSNCPGAFFLSYKELDVLFGRGRFAHLNQRLQIVEVVREWLPRQSACDYLPCEATRAYRLVSDIADALRGYIDSLRNAVVPLIHTSGRRCLTPPQAIAPKKRDGSPRKVWRGVKLRNRTPLNLDGLESLRASLSHIERHGWSSTGECAPLGPAEQEHVRRLCEDTESIIFWGSTQAAGRGFLAHRYVEADNGRLTAIGVNLQSCWGVIRRAAFQGLWDLDISNCHLTIIEQLARERGVHCHEIRRYLAHKKPLREQLAWRHLLGLDEVKQCLIAIVYGAYVSSDADYAIGDLIGSFRASTFINDPDVRGIAEDVKKARRAILKSWPRGRRRLHNAAGGSILLVDPETGKEATAAQMLACIVQGIEAMMLRAVVREYGKHIVLVQHDGFTSEIPLDIARIEALIQRETGFEVAVEQEQIKPVLPTQLSEILGTRFSLENNDLDANWFTRLQATAPMVVVPGVPPVVAPAGCPGGSGPALGCPGVQASPSDLVVAGLVVPEGSPSSAAGANGGRVGVGAGLPPPWSLDLSDPWWRLRPAPLLLPPALHRR
jgi:hypothetical protein